MRTVIDVSEHQGWIDWDAANSEIAGAIVRVGYGSDYASQDDKYAARNMDECERLGIPYGVYIYSYAADLGEVASEIEHALRMVEGRNPVLGVWFDTEQSGLESISWDASDAFCRAMADAGHRTGVYCYQSWYWSCLQGIEASWPVWFASYTDSPSMPDNVHAWQYTSDGGVAGISGRVDMNHWYNDEWFESEEEMIDYDLLADKVAERVWNFVQNGTLMRDRMQGTDEAACRARDELTRKDDVSGRGTEATLFERACWIGARTEEIVDGQEAIAQKLDTVLGKL